jgi:hypothetical protein
MCIDNALGDALNNLLADGSITIEGGQGTVEAVANRQDRRRLARSETRGRRGARRVPVCAVFVAP